MSNTKLNWNLVSAVLTIIAIIVSFATLEVRCFLRLQSESCPGNLSGIPEAAYANGKYSNLIQKIECPRDSLTYGEFTDFGFWRGGEWCGQDASAGYWVWVRPNWYIWKDVNR